MTQPKNPSDDDRQEIQELVSSDDAVAKLRGLLLLEASGLTGADLQVFFPEAVKDAAMALVDDLQLKGEDDVGLGLLTGNEEMIQAGEQKLADSLRCRAVFSLLMQHRLLELHKLGLAPDKPLVDLVEIPSGVFTMGSPGDEEARGDDEDAVITHIKKPFFLGRTVITQAQWFAIMGTEPWTLEGTATIDEGGEVVGISFDPFDGRLQCGDDYPTVFVTWQHAVLFCQMLTALERKRGHISDRQVYRLPTEAEWESACRAGTSSAYSFGNDPDELGEHGWFVENSEDQLQAVAQLRPNPWGLCDVHGNVSEWCSDWYAPKLFGGDDPSGPPSGSRRIVRGGSGEDEASSCRSAARLAWEPWLRDWHLLSVGFRVALTNPE